ncbi:MAG: acyl-CoA thioesterase [Balneola sp.]|nr:MAG: acyl-CoA thioesterase [Balneola sp.]
MMRPSYDPNLFYYWHTIQTRFRDLDPLNHANNAVFNTYFEEARIHFVNQVPELAHSFAEGKAFVLVKCTLEYLKPIHYPATLLVGSSCLSIGNTSVEAFQAIYDSETKNLLAVATTKGVWFDIKRNRPTAVPNIDNKEPLMFKLPADG